MYIYVRMCTRSLLCAVRARCSLHAGVREGVIFPLVWDTLAGRGRLIYYTRVSRE